ncbi:uncharacterized protein LOC115679830 isoform X2 [Syzygium oleosum]|uniref:uncharacterized protein LOC115679830 isoform X2 n=1 Tax=Syzygium oleosum TaxID=219896 RepID=UPI0011D23A6A|nr:uncharacterized protein LOC115679830 isoform X2 [Syzygium oleosum]
MASLQTHQLNPQFHRRFSLLSPKHGAPRRVLGLSRHFPASFSRRIRAPELPESCRGGDGDGGRSSFECCCQASAEVAKIEASEENERRPFDINLAVILAGFAFEAYTTPPENIGRREVDAAGCKTVYLSESFVRKIYDGQLFIKLKKGINLPAMDLWGTSDPYVVMQLDGQVVKSKVKWGTKKPTWNEEFTFNIKLPPTKNLQVAAWDANLVTPHKRMGNAGICLEPLCDGDSHEMVVELEGMGGGGKIQLEVRYKSFDEIDEGKKWWKLPFVSEFLRQNGFESTLKSIVGSESVPARQFVEYAFGQLKSFNETYPWKDKLLNSGKYVAEGESVNATAAPEKFSSVDSVPLLNEQSLNEENIVVESSPDSTGVDYTNAEKMLVGESIQFDKHFWKNFADVINKKVVQKLGLPVPENVKWDGFDVLKKIGIQSRKVAEEGYVESGLATPSSQEIDDSTEDGPLPRSAIQSSITDIKQVTQDLLQQTDSVLGALMVLTAAVSRLNKEATHSMEKNDNKMKNDGSVYSKNENLAVSSDVSLLDDKEAEEMKALFSSAESAMEAWAMLATSLGHPSFVKSEFEKICFLDNASTDTQAAIWRDSARRRLLVAFRGTEQSRWKDLRTDLMLAPAGLNPERIGGDFKEEVQVHSGFLSAYDSVRIRILSLLKMAIGFVDDGSEPQYKWHVYVTGHSLGGALATLLALELSSSQLAKRGAIYVTMYNFGSPRVGNRRFAELYNEKVKDSWRVVNHRDIIPSVPRLMGYCHVAQPVYLAAGEIKDALVNVQSLADGYEGDFVGESTPDVLISEFMKGEKELIEKILETEINIYRSIRDGSALMQHMEDFYYITLLESVRSNYQSAERLQTSDEATDRQLNA